MSLYVKLLTLRACVSVCEAINTACMCLCNCFVFVELPEYDQTSVGFRHLYSSRPGDQGLLGIIRLSLLAWLIVALVDCWTIVVYSVIYIANYELELLYVYL